MESGAWQYHNRSDRHSKIASWGIVLDLLEACPLLRQHVAAEKVGFGINHEMRDFRQNRKKDLDLVLCIPSPGDAPDQTFAGRADHYGIVLDSSDRAALNAMPQLRRAPVGAVLVALEAKACMTAHQKALSRLYDELNSSHLTVHGAADAAIAAGFVMINAATSFASPTKGGAPNRHVQPRATEITKAKVAELPRRSATGQTGFDAIAVVVVDCKNDGSPVSLITDGRAEAPRHISLREHDPSAGQLYATRFKDI